MADGRRSQNPDLVPRLTTPKRAPRRPPPFTPARSGLPLYQEAMAETGGKNKERPGTDSDTDSSEEEVANISARAAAAARQSLLDMSLDGRELVRAVGAGTRPPTQMDRMVAAADAAVLAAIEDDRRKSMTPGRALGARPRTATGVELSPSKRMGTSLSAFDPVGIRPISTGPGYKDRRSEVFPAAGTLRRYEIGNPDPPPLGTLPARGAAVTSSPDGAAALNRSFMFDEQGFDENPWNTPSLNLIGNYTSQTDLRRRLQQDQREKSTEMVIQQVTELSKKLLELKEKELALEKEKRELAIRERAADSLIDAATRQLQQVRSAERIAAARQETAANVENTPPPPPAVEPLLLNLEEIRQDITVQQERVNVAQERMDRATAAVTAADSGRDSSVVGVDTLVKPFVNIAKVVNTLNDPEKRDDPQVREKNERYLRRITAELVERGLHNSLQEFREQQDMKTAHLVGTMVGRERGDILQIIDENVNSRLKRIEENEKLVARANTEKKDEVRVLLFYPPEPGAPGEVYRKALAQSNNTIRVIERTVLFNQDPFNFVMRLCRESNKIAADYQLSKKQQWALIFEHIPVGDDYAYLHRSRDLEDLFLTVSTLATQVVTRPNLEKQINEWKLVNTNETDMFRSITRLFNLLDKIRADFGQTEANTVELFRQAVALISRQEGLPRYIQEALELARLRVKDSDSTGEMTQVLVSACQRYVGQRPAKNQVKAIEYIPDGHASNYAAAVHQMQYPALMPPPPPAQPAQQAQSQQPGKKNNFRGRSKSQKRQGQGKGQQNQQPAQNQKQQQDGNKNQQKKGGQNRGRPRFVKPWPENTPYLSRNGNQLSADFNKHFNGFCYKCGFNRHDSDNCNIYPEKHTVITLCCTCRQGLHDVCRSKRRDLVNAAAIKEGVEKGVKAIVNKMTVVPPPMQPMYWPYAAPPPPSQQSIQQVTTVTEDSESD